MTRIVVDAGDSESGYLRLGFKAQEGSGQVRIYDRDHRDYHNWDDHEDRACRGYLVEHHRSYREFHRQHHRVQRHYWNWRHRHPDHD